MTRVLKREILELALWCNVLSYCQQCQHPGWALVRVLAVPLIYLPANNGPEETPDFFLALGMNQLMEASPSFSVSHSLALSLSLYLSLKLPFK